MDAAVMDRNAHRHNCGASQPVPHSRGPVYNVSSRRCSSYQHDRPQHPSLTRVKGRINMYTPPRMSTEISWLNDQSPVNTDSRTPPHQCKIPDNGTPTLVHPASTLLQDLLKEQRAHRGSRAASEDWEDDTGPRTPEGSRTQEDSASEKARKINDAFSAGLRKPREMGMREMDQYVSKINKLNFDLKLEIFHRTQQMKTLEKKLGRMQEMEEELERMHTLEDEVKELQAAEKDNQDLRQSNEKLRKELEKRDQAISEAVELICQLESKIDQLDPSGRTSQMSMAHNAPDDGSNVSTPKAQVTVDIPKRTSSKRDQTVETGSSGQRSLESRQLNRAPSFLRADNRSTATLRSLYTENNLSRSALSELTKSESLQTMNEAMEPGSPRLSVLSECSELHSLDSPSRNVFDQLKIPVRKVSSTTGSLDSFVPAAEQEQSKESQINQWMESRPDTPQTIITIPRHRAYSDASKTGTPSFEDDLYSNKHRPRPRLDTSLFGGARLPPTPDTMSTAYAAVSNGSNGSIVTMKSPQPEQDPWFAGRRLDRPRSVDELTSRRSLNGSQINDSMQADCGDAPPLGMTISESPTIYPFNTVAFKASQLLGPGSPNNPGIKPFGGYLQQDSKAEVVSPQKKRNDSPPKTVTPNPRSKQCDSSPPLTPEDWLAAAKLGPRSRKERPHPRQQQTKLPSRNVVSQAAFHDDGRSIQSDFTEVPGIPTLDPDALDMQSLAGSESEPRRSLSLRQPFFNRSVGGPRRLQSSPMTSDFVDDDDDGAPPPNIPKTRNTGSASRRPGSQIGDLYPSSGGDGSPSPAPKALHQSLMESRMPSSHSATISGGRPSTSHSMEHKRRSSSLGIFSWMKGVSGKRSEPTSPFMTDRFDAAHKEQRTPARLVKEAGSLARASGSTPASMDVYPHPETWDDYSRRPRYMGRRARRG